MPRTARMPLPTQERLKELLDYNPDTGVVTAKMTRLSKHSAYLPGQVVGYPSPQGYLKITIDGVLHPLHRIIWKWMTGDDPSLLDHINRARADNRWSNLRLATPTENRANSGPSRLNTSGVKGVRMIPLDGQWDASATIKGKSVRLGTFRTRDEAAAAYEAVAKAEYGDFYTPERGEQRIFYDVVELADKAFIDEVLRLARGIRAALLLRPPGWQEQIDQDTLSLLNTARSR
jgi:hypothetical protein